MSVGRAQGRAFTHIERGARAAPPKAAPDSALRVTIPPTHSASTAQRAPSGGSRAVSVAPCRRLTDAERSAADPMRHLGIVHAIATAHRVAGAIRVVDALVSSGVAGIIRDATVTSTSAEGRAAPTARAIGVDLTTRLGATIAGSVGGAAQAHFAGRAIRVREAVIVAAVKANASGSAAPIGARGTLTALRARLQGRLRALSGASPGSRARGHATSGRLAAMLRGLRRDVSAAATAACATAARATAARATAARATAARASRGPPTAASAGTGRAGTGRTCTRRTCTRGVAARGVLLSRAEGSAAGAHEQEGGEPRVRASHSSPFLCQ